MSNYLDLRKGKAGQEPLSYVIPSTDDTDSEDAQDEYTRALWAASFYTEEYKEDNRGTWIGLPVLFFKTNHCSIVSSS